MSATTRLRPYNRARGGLTRSFPQGIGAPAMLVNILGIIDDAKCYEMVRHLRWPDGVRCPHCDSGRGRQAGPG